MRSRWSERALIEACHSEDDPIACRMRSGD